MGDADELRRIARNVNAADGRALLAIADRLEPRAGKQRLSPAARDEPHASQLLRLKASDWFWLSALLVLMILL